MLGLPLVEVVNRLASGEITPRRLFEARVEAVERHGRETNAFISVFQAGRTDSAAKTPLAGATIALKDNIYFRGHRTTAGSRVLGRFVPSNDADIVRSLRRAGASFIGKTNMHEFAFGVTNINPHYGACRNPWDAERISGGSSGGSAAAVAAGMCCAAMGTDTAGSVRIPAALCGVVGFKPTNGMISIGGIVPLAWSLDAVGFLTRTVGDAALLTSLTVKRGELNRRVRPLPLKGVRIGVPRNLLAGVEADVRRRFEGSLDAAEREGARLVSLVLPNYKETLACRSILVHAEAAAYHRRFYARKYGQYGPDIRPRIAQGLAIPAAVYLDALRARGRLIQAYRSLFSKMDFVATPTTSIPAPTVKDSQVAETAALIRRQLLAFTEPFNVYGAPAISLPCGRTRAGLPTGLHLAADLYSDERLLCAASSFERILPTT